MPNELLLYGEVGVDFTSTDIKTQLAAMDTSDELVVRIDSPGGSVFQGFSIQEAIAQYPGPKRAVVESAAVSIASYILTAFDDVAIARNGYVMIHNPNLQMEGDDEAFTKAAADLTKYKATMIADYADRTGKSQDEVLEMMKAETYLNADEAIEMGIATSKTEPVPSRVVTAKTKQIPTAVARSLASAKGFSGDPLTKESPVSEQPKRVAATVSQIRSMAPTAKSDFIVRCMEKEMTAEEVREKAMEEIQAENEELKAKLSAMEEEEEQARAKAEEEEKAKAEEEEKARAQEEEETTARARARGHQPVAVANRSGGASATKRWREAVDNCLERGMPRARAVQQASRLNPGLREQYLAEVNAAVGRN